MYLVTDTVTEKKNVTSYREKDTRKVPVKSAGVVPDWNEIEQN